MTLPDSSVRIVEALLATAVHGIVTFDKHGKLLTCNDATRSIFGYSKQDLCGGGLHRLLAEPHAESFVNDLAAYLRSGRSTFVGATSDIEGRRADGSRFPMDFSVSRSDLDDHAVFLGVFRDTTKRKQASEALRRSEERFDLAVRGSRDGLWDWDIVTDEVYYAPQYRKLLGFDESEYPGVADSFRAHLHPDDRDRVFSAFMAHLKDRVPFDEEFRHRTHVGSIRYLRARGQAIWGPDGKATRMAGSIADITESKLFERALAEARDAAEAASRSKSRFLANMSHELRTPLNSVIGFSNVLLRNPALATKTRTYLERIRDNGLHLLSLINEVLDISRIEAGRMEMQIEPVRVDKIVREAVEATEGTALEKGIRLDAEIPEVKETIAADEKRLKQVLINLIGNAIKFTDKGGVEVRLECAERSGRPLSVAIVDSGIGIPADRLDHVFEAFLQVDSSSTRRHAGSGLGLAISRSFCRLMGFDLTASSRIDHGSTFTVVFERESRTVR